MQGSRLKHSLITLAGGLALLALGSIFLANTASLDLSRFQSNSLSPATTAMLHQLEGPVTVTAHIENKPELRQRVLTALEPFQREKPDIHLIWEDLQTPNADNKIVKKPHLTLRHGDFQTVLTHLQRSQLAGAFYQLSRGKQRWIAFARDGGSKSLEDSGESGYNSLKKLLENQGYKTLSVKLGEPDTLLPDNLDLLVLPAPEQPLPELARQRIGLWLGTGRALLWLQENDLGAEDQALMEEQLNTHLLPGHVVSSDSALRATLGLRHPAVIPVIDTGYASEHPVTRHIRGVSLLPVTRAVESLGLPPWKSQPLLQSSAASWNETSPLQGHLEADGPAEQAGPLTLMLAQTRPHGGEEQRIILSGDSDFLSNDYLGYGNNRQLALRLFGWLSGDDEQLLDMAADTLPDATLQLSPALLIALATTFLILLPGGLLLTGAILWYRRKHA